MLLSLELDSMSSSGISGIADFFRPNGCDLLCVVPLFWGGLPQSCQRLTCLFSLACNGVDPICNRCQSWPSTTVKYYSGKLSRCPPWSGFHQNNYAPTDNIYVKQLRSGEDPELRNTPKNASY